MSPRRTASPPWQVIIPGAVVVVVVGGFAAFRSGDAPPSPEPSPSSAAAASASLAVLLAGGVPSGTFPGQGAAAPGGGAPVSRAQILSRATLTEAIEIARPAMTNAVGRLDRGSALLSLWAAGHLTWEALAAVPATSPALFRKDPEAERGKRLCITGLITEIRAEKKLDARLLEDRAQPLVERSAGTAAPLPRLDIAVPEPGSGAEPGLPVTVAPSEDFTVPDDGKVFFATVVSAPDPPRTELTGGRGVTRPALAVQLIAVRSSGGLVDGSEATACGVLTGVTLPALGGPSSSSDGPVHRMVGLFDLPENRGTSR